MSVLKFVAACALSTAALTAQLVGAPLSAAQSTDDPVIQWNRTLLAIVRTPGAQPATIHPTRSLAMLHAAIYDAVVGNTPPDPAHPGAHAVISAAGAPVLVAVLQRDHLDFTVTSEVSGHRLGRDVAHFVLDHFLTRRHPQDEDDRK